ncbi:hypothetical protein LIER_19892 [Lithospermum erythrorhizon]|uniref:Uncharacterized protein n=1 Tax=Lithospermum erythrorhizon TaxID=34254 RepID=A0AAV3QJE0_LITER
MKKRKKSLLARSIGKEKIQKVESASSPASKVVEDTSIEEIFFHIDDDKRLNLDRKLIKTIEQKNFMDSAILDSCSGAMNISELKAKTRRPSLMSSITTATQSPGYKDDCSELDCIGWFVDMIDQPSYNHLKSDNFLRKELEYIFLSLHYNNHFSGK